MLEVQPRRGIDYFRWIFQKAEIYVQSLFDNVVFVMLAK